MDKLTVTHTLAGKVEYPIHPARAKVLYLQGYIVRDGPGKYVEHPAISDNNRFVLVALTDLEGKYL